MKKCKNIVKIILLVVVILLMCNKSIGRTAKEQIEANNALGDIYVIGNDNLGDLESYNNITKEYVGVLPELFKKIKKETGLNLKYLENTASRKANIKNMQGEIVSGIIDDEYMEYVTDKIEILTLNDEESVYIGFTKMVNEDIKNAIKEYIENMSSSEREKVILSVLQKDANPYNMKNQYQYVTLVIGIFFITFIVIAYIRKLKEKIKREKCIDEVTEFSNYNNFTKTYNNCIANEIKSSYCIVDLGINIKNIEDTYGYAEEEKILKAISEAINDHISENEMFSRRTSNSFVILIESVSSKHLEEKIIIINEKIKKKCKQMNVNIDISFGIYEIKNSNIELEKAVYYAMKARKECEKTNNLMLICNKSLEKKINENLDLEKNIMQIVNNKEFVSYVRPIIDLKTNSVYALNFLARIDNEINGLIKPKKFIKILEKNNLTYELDKLMFENACKLSQYLVEKENKHIKMFCNFSRSSLTTNEFLKDIKNILSSYNVNPNMIGIVITQSFANTKLYSIKNVVRELKKLGFLIILDNLEEGFNSIKDIFQFECDLIKVSNRILKEAEEETNHEIIGQFISLMQKLNISVIGNDIEDKAMEQILIDAGVNLVEGSLYCSSIPIGELDIISTDKQNLIADIDILQ